MLSIDMFPDSVEDLKLEGHEREAFENILKEADKYFFDGARYILQDQLDIDASVMEEKEIEISLSFVDEDEIKELNASHRNKNRVTDVLSFPQYENLEEIKLAIDKEPMIFLGDVAICLKMAIAQSKEYGHSFMREVIFLYVHSLLHLLGYDHMNEDDGKIMRQLEKEYMLNLNVLR